jgi:hypothetical protein
MPLGFSVSKEEDRLWIWWYTPVISALRKVR